MIFEIKRAKLGVVYFDQLLGAARTRKLVKILFWAVFNLFCSFQTFFSDFSSEIKKKPLKKQHFKLLFKAGRHANAGRLQKRLKMAQKKYFNQLSGMCSNRKLVKIHNT